MKKFLSLVLALVMTMSLVTISAGAKTFNDDDKIQYNEAVEVMKAVKVIDGYTDGSFNPSNTLTRGAAAKIICNMLLGPTTADALPTTAAPFKDVAAGSTYAGYIAYCSKEGIVDGYADGTFRPGAPLTGYAFMKMLLVSLGYDADIEGYVGDNWAVSVAKRALKLGLDKGLVDTLNGTKTVTREEACLFAFNAMQKKTVTYTGRNEINVGGVTVSAAGNLAEDDTTFMSQNFKNLAKTVVLNGVGEPSNKWTLKNKEIGTYAWEADATYTDSVKEKNVYTDLALTGTSQDFKVVEAKKTTVGNSGAQYDMTITKGLDSDMPYANTGITTKFFVDADSDVYYVSVVHPVIGKVSSVGKNEDGDRVVRVDSKEFKTEDFAKNDMVIYTTAWDNDNGAVVIDTMTAVEKQTGTVTKKVGTTTLYIDGTKYSLSKSDGKDTSAFASLNAKDEVEFYLDAEGNVIKVDVSKVSATMDNLALVEKAGEVDGYDTTYKATLRLPDGSKKVVETDVDYSTYADKLVTYKLDADGDTVLTRDADSYYYYAKATKGISFVKGQPSLTGEDDAVLTNESSETKTSVALTTSTRFVYGTTSDNVKYTYKTYDGYKNAPSFDDADFVAVYVKDNKAVCVYVITGDTALSVSGDESVFVIRNKSAKLTSEADIVDYYEYAVIDNGKIGTVKMDSDKWYDLMAVTTLLDDNYYVAGFNSLRSMADGSVQCSEGNTISNGLHASSIEVTDNGTTVILDDSTSYALADDAKIYVVNSDCDEIVVSDIDGIADGSRGSGNDDIYKDIYVTVETGKLIIETLIVVEK